MMSLNFISKQLNQEVTLDMIVFYTTVFFMSKLLDENNQYNFSKVKRYVKQEMFRKKKIILPINIQNTHWASGGIDSGI